MRRKIEKIPCVGRLIFCLSLALSGCGGSASSVGGTGTPPAIKGQWTWMSGASTPTQSAVYGIKGTPSSKNVPGARFGAASWTDSQGNLWLFGGYGIVSYGNVGPLNDLWEYSNGQWIWISGSNTPNQPGVFGTMGVPAPANTPGARVYPAYWTDAQGNFWLFSGDNSLSDLWKYSNGMWTWMAGSNSLPNSGNPRGVYGTRGQPSSSNVPGPRGAACTWIDSTGNLWLYGGDGWGADGHFANLADMWEYSNSMWTWIAGSDQPNIAAVYGNQGIASSSNTPGWRDGAASWSDAQGNFWIFGGLGNLGSQNDVWMYSKGQWTWVDGSNQGDQTGGYITQGVSGQGNFPGGRDYVASWTDAQGNFWLFGGSQSPALLSGGLEDFWEYGDKQWTWVDGPSFVQLGVQSGDYGTLGVTSVNNFPPARSNAVVWVDKKGNFWLFGGANVDITPIAWYNDLWEYTP